MTLAELNPTAVGLQAAQLAAAAMKRLAETLSLPLLPPLDDLEQLDQCDLARDVATLTRWAQTGEGTSAAEAYETLTRTKRTLYVSVMGGELDGFSGADTSTTLALACATARLGIVNGEPVTTTDLARLASVTPARVRQLVTAGEIEGSSGKRGSTAGTVAAAAAAAWLKARGLKGW